MGGSGALSDSEVIVTGVLLVYVLGPVLFIFLINDLYDLTKNSLMKFLDKPRCTLEVRIRLLMILRNWRKGCVPHLRKRKQIPK